MATLALRGDHAVCRSCTCRLVARCTLRAARRRTSARYQTGLSRFTVYAASSGGAINPDGIIGPDGEILKRAPLDPEERRALWKRAIKLPMYSVGLAPVLVSATAAFVYTGAFQPLKTLGLCIAAIAIIAWLNLSNDVFDSSTGVDRNKPESVVNLTGNWKKVFLVANVFLLIGAGLLFSIVSSVVRFHENSCWYIVSMAFDFPGSFYCSQINLQAKLFMLLFAVATYTKDHHLDGATLVSVNLCVFWHLGHWQQTHFILRKFQLHRQYQM